MLVCLLAFGPLDWIVREETARNMASAFASGSNFRPRNEKERTLANLFQPPKTIMTLGDFESVRLDAMRRAILLLRMKK